MKYTYPAIFTEEREGGYSVSFPNIEGCCTCGDNLQHALDMAQDALCLMLYDMEKENAVIPNAAKIKEIEVDEESFVTLVSCDTDFYKRFYDSKSVKKNLTIPAWLNDAAERDGINFSQVLQDAIKQKLGV